jgi:hypothetical protein
VTDEELLHIASEFRDGILDGDSSAWKCYMVSAPLQGYLAFAGGPETELVETDLGHMNHIWLRLPDGRALDPTADQFNALFPDMNLPPVYLGPPLAIHGATGEICA